MQPPSVFVPNLGFRPSEGGVRLRAPLVVQHEGRTLKVQRLVSTSLGTELRFELSGMQMSWRDASRDVRCELHDENGHSYGPGRGRWASGWAEGRMHRVTSFEPIASTLRRIQLVVLEGPVAISAWLDLEPLAESGLPRRHPLTGEDTKHGVTIRLGGIAIGEGATVLELEVSADPYVRHVRGICALSGMRRDETKLRLRDDKGRELVELDPKIPPLSDPRGGTEVAVFPTVPGGWSSFDLVVDYVVVEEVEGQVEIAVPVTQPRTYDFGRYPIRVRASRIVDPPPIEQRSPFNPSAGFAAVHIDLALEDWHEDRRLLFPASVLSDGNDYPFRWQPAPSDRGWINARQVTNIEAPSPDPASVGVVTLRYPTVHLRGPWTIHFARPNPTTVA